MNDTVVIFQESAALDALRSSLQGVTALPIHGAARKLRGRNARLIILYEWDPDARRWDYHMETQRIQAYAAETGADFLRYVNTPGDLRGLLASAESPHRKPPESL